MGLTIQDGKLVLRDGALGTEAACCCGGGCCCINGEPDETKTTQAECQEAGGVWSTLPCSSSPCLNGCCCSEQLDISYEAASQAYCNAPNAIWLPPEQCTLELNTCPQVCTENAPRDEGGGCPDGFTDVSWYDENGNLVEPIGSGGYPVPCNRVRYIRHCITTPCVPTQPGGEVNFALINCWDVDNHTYEDDNPFP